MWTRRCATQPTMADHRIAGVLLAHGGPLAFTHAAFLTTCSPACHLSGRLRPPRAQPLSFRCGRTRLVAQHGKVGAGAEPTGGSSVDEGEAQAVDVYLLAI